jgi:hypothetical protein
MAASFLLLMTCTGFPPEQYPYPFRSQMARVELEGEFSEVVRNA